MFINRFQKAIMAYGVAEIDVFQTVDLWERKDISQVTNTIFALGRSVSTIRLSSHSWDEKFHDILWYVQFNWYLIENPGNGV